MVIFVTERINDMAYFNLKYHKPKLSLNLDKVSFVEFRDPSDDDEYGHDWQIIIHFSDDSILTLESTNKDRIDAIAVFLGVTPIPT